MAGINRNLLQNVLLTILFAWPLFFIQSMMFTNNPAVAVPYALVMSGFMGVLAVAGSAYRGWLQRRAFTGKKMAAASMDAHQQRTVDIDLPGAAAFNLVLDALRSLDNQPVPVADDMLIRLESLLPRRQRLRLDSVDAAGGEIKAALRGRVLGIPDWMDLSRITIQVQRLDAQTSRVSIDCRPPSGVGNLNAVYDLGRNLHYANHLALYLRRESQQTAAVERLSHQPDETATGGQAGGQDEQQQKF